MKILIINPNTTASMTELIGEEARLAASEQTEIVAINPLNGPPAIQGAADGDAALPHLIELFDRQVATGEYDAVIIACFDDTGLWQLKERSGLPVIGIGEAGFHAAMLLGKRFSVVTTLPVSVPVIEENIADQGISARCAKVRATEIPVLELEANRGASFLRISQEIGAALTEDRCDSIVLGCAGMTDIAEELQKKFKIPIIDGVKAAVGLCEMLYKVDGNRAPFSKADASVYDDGQLSSVEV